MDERQEPSGKNLISINKISLSKFQARKKFNQEKLKELSESIEKNGLLQPIIIRKGKKNFELVAGERRLKACRLIGHKEISAIISNFDDKKAFESGLDEDEDVFAPIFQSTKRRSIWLGVNLITVFIAVYCIGLFEATLQQKIALAILMPVVASMGGIAGTQTLIIVTRGIATGKVTTANIKALVNKEVAVSGLNGIIWSIVIGLITYYWFSDLLLSLIIALAIITNLVVAAFSGAFLPLLLTKLKIDPALAGGVILTTITDVIGFVAFLGLAALFI